MKPTENEGGYFRWFQAFIVYTMVPPSVMERDSLTYWRVFDKNPLFRGRSIEKFLL
jgi:hypothetical protein